ncbi:MAG: phosphatidylinositol mannoside acyltransferase [Micrococcales bacterium]|nr:phosphatidylinositol mannoside acyltransferase [Micrococcales bacterium]
MNLTALAWRVVPRLPQRLAAGIFNLAADLSWAVRSKNCRRLTANLARVRPEMNHRQIRRLTRRGLRRTLKYYREAFCLGRYSQGQIDRLVHLEDHDRVVKMLGQPPQGILAMGHMGNWDAAGAWSAVNLAPVITVGEHVQPERLFQEFMAMRARIGMTVIPFEKGQSAYHQLLAKAQVETPYIMPLLADRDLSSSGVEVDMFGRKMLVGAGPAVLAIDTGRPLLPVSMHSRGRNYVLRIHLAIEPKAGLSRSEQVQYLSQAWASVLAKEIYDHPADWHMYQKVFVEDLDPARLAKVRQLARGVNDGGEPA